MGGSVGKPSALQSLRKVSDSEWKELHLAAAPMSHIEERPLKLSVVRLNVLRNRVCFAAG